MFIGVYNKYVREERLRNNFKEVPPLDPSNNLKDQAKDMSSIVSNNPDTSMIDLSRSVKRNKEIRFHSNLRPMKSDHMRNDAHGETVTAKDGESSKLFGVRPQHHGETHFNRSEDDSETYLLNRIRSFKKVSPSPPSKQQANRDHATPSPISMKPLSRKPSEEVIRKQKIAPVPVKLRDNFPIVGLINMSQKPVLHTQHQPQIRKNIAVPANGSPLKKSLVNNAGAGNENSALTHKNSGTNLDTSNISEKLYHKSEAYVQKNRKEVESALKNILKPNSNAGNSRAPSVPVYNNQKGMLVKQHTYNNVDKLDKSDKKHGLLSHNHLYHHRSSLLVGETHDDKEKAAKKILKNRSTKDNSLLLETHEIKERFSSNQSSFVSFQSPGFEIDSLTNREHTEHTNRATEQTEEDGFDKDISRVDSMKKIKDFSNKKKEAKLKRQNNSKILSDHTLTLRDKKSDPKIKSAWMPISVAGLKNPAEDVRRVTSKEEFWQRIEQKTKNQMGNSIGFDFEIQRVEKLFHRNESAFANLVSVRENLLGIYVKEGIHRDFTSPLLSVPPQMQKTGVHKKS